MSHLFSPNQYTIDKSYTYKAGHLAFQQHNEGSVVEYRNVTVKRLPDDEKAAWEQAKQDLPEPKGK